jgi:hypothetical protein
MIHNDKKPHTEQTEIIVDFLQSTDTTPTERRIRVATFEIDEEVDVLSVLDIVVLNDFEDVIEYISMRLNEGLSDNFLFEPHGTCNFDQLKLLLKK